MRGTRRGDGGRDLPGEGTDVVGCGTASERVHGSLRATGVVAATAAAFIFSVLPALPLSAQTIEGQVADGETFEVLEQVSITLMHPDGHDLAEAVQTSSSGRFSVSVPGPGAYYLRAERLGYTTIVEGVFEFASSEGRLAVEVFLRRAPVEVEGIDVTVDQVQVRRHLRAAGYYERLAEGFGDFITPEQIEERGMVGNVSDYLRHLTGVGTRGSVVLFRAHSPGSTSGVGCPPRGQGRPVILCKDDGTYESTGMCEPNVWVDGVLMGQANSNGRLRTGDLSKGLDDFLTPLDVVAIEVYRGLAGTPLQWAGLNGSCGAIVIYTKQGG